MSSSAVSNVKNVLGNNLKEVIAYSKLIKKQQGEFKIIKINDTSTLYQADNRIAIRKLNQCEDNQKKVDNIKWDTEINIIGEYFLCFFDRSKIRSGSFLKECNDCISSLITFIFENSDDYVSSNVADKRASVGKRMKRSWLVFLIEVLKEFRQPNIKDLFRELDDCLNKARFGDQYYYKVVTRSHNHRIILAFYNFISYEVDLYDSSRVGSILNAVLLNFADNEKRCNLLHVDSETLSCHWRLFVFI